MNQPIKIHESPPRFVNPTIKKTLLLNFGDPLLSLVIFTQLKDRLSKKYVGYFNY